LSSHFVCSDRQKFPSAFLYITGIFLLHPPFPSLVQHLSEPDCHPEYKEVLSYENIVTYIRVKRLVWAGHLIRMNNDRMLKKIFNTKPGGVRSVGRPKLRWEDGIDQDMRILGVKNWKKVAPDRDEWAKLLKKARAHQGLSSQ